MQSMRFAYGPALVAVGVLMLGSMRGIAFDDLTEVVPAFACIALVVFTYNIANGLSAGLALYPLLKLAAGRARELKGGALALSAACWLYFIFGLPP
jgi:AGZA family xanthine/uracil permease-like MFS transporter